MPKLRKEDTEDLNIDELESAEYTEGGNYTSYDGDVPPNDTILRAYVKAMWWTRTQGGDPMIKVLVEADENEGELEDYNGLPAWENMALTTGAKFKWAPFLEHFGLTIRDVKSKTTVAAEDDNIGAPIEKIATFAPGSDESWCRIITSREKYNGEWQAHVAGWLDYEESEDEDEGAESDEDVEDEEDEDEDEEDEDEDEEVEETEEEPEPEKPARSSRRSSPAKPAAKPAAARSASKASKPAASATTRPASRRSAPAASAPAKAKAPAAPRRGRRSAASTDEPPF